MLPSGVWVYFILLPNEEDSIDSVLVCNPSGKEIPMLKRYYYPVNPLCAMAANGMKTV